MAFQEYPKWIETPDSTPEERRGKVVQNKKEEQELLQRLAVPEPKLPEKKLEAHPADLPGKAIAHDRHGTHQ